MGAQEGTRAADGARGAERVHTSDLSQQALLGSQFPPSQHHTRREHASSIIQFLERGLLVLHQCLSALCSCVSGLLQDRRGPSHKQRWVAGKIHSVSILARKIQHVLQYDRAYHQCQLAVSLISKVPPPKPSVPITEPHSDQ